MPQQQDVVMLARLVGLAIIVIGFLFTIWDATDLGYATKSQSFRFFIENTLEWVFRGGVLIVAAEIAGRLTSRSQA
jgi:hypothetical protein